MTVKLENGKALFNGEGISVYELKIGSATKDMFLQVSLIPNQYSKENGVEMEDFLVDILNETVIQKLAQEGFKLISEENVVHIQNSDW